jgi:peroxiredoxin
MKNLIVALLLLVSTPLIAHGQGATDETASREPAAVALLQQANEAIKATQSWAYSFTYKGDGWMVGDFRGMARLRRGSNLFDSAFLVNIDMPREKGGRVTAREGYSGERNRVQLASDGNVIQMLDENRKTLKYGKINSAGHLFFYAYYTIWTQVASIEPFRAELQSKTIRLQGRETIRGVPCHVVRIIDPFGNQVWWYLSRRDRLPRAQKLLNERPGTEASFFFQISDLKTDDELQTTDYHLSTPDGYILINEDERPLEVGAEAPQFRLRTVDGGEVPLAAWRGKVVVLDFWASWCPPCWTVMPKINRLAKEFGAKQVEFIGINTWESPAVNPRDYMSGKAFGYKLLFDHDGSAALAYKLVTLPGIFVIDPKGKLVYAQTGDKAELEQDLRKAITEARAR